MQMCDNDISKLNVNTLFKDWRNENNKNRIYGQPC